MTFSEQLNEYISKLDAQQKIFQMLPDYLLLF